MEKALKYWPVAVASFAILSAGVTAQIQIKLNAIEIADLSEGLDEAEEWLSELQYQLDNLE